MRRCFLAMLVTALSAWVQLAAEEAKPNAVPVTGVADADLASFDEMMSKFMSDNQVPGAALAVARTASWSMHAASVMPINSLGFPCNRGCAPALPASPSRSRRRRFCASSSKAY